MTTIVEFKAGKMDWDGRLVTADKRKGKLALVKDGEDLHHVTWTDRATNEEIDNWVVVEDAYLEKVNKCTTGRVYVLKYLSSKIRLFFWMQEPKEDDDHELVKKFNDAIGAEIPSSGANPRPAQVAPATGADADLQNQLMALIRNVQVPAQARGPRVSLPSVLKPDVLTTLGEDAEALAELRQHMPADQQKDEDIVETLRCPQLRGSMSALSQAIHSDQLRILWTELGLAGSPQPGEDPMEALCKALEQKHKAP